MENEENAAEQKKSRILVIDDEELLLALAEAWGKKLSKGCHVETFAKPLEALQSIENDPESVRVLITYLIMPEIPGDKLVEAARKIVRQDVVIIFVSGGDMSSTPKNNEWAKKHGGDAFFQKPVNYQTVGKRIKELLAEKNTNGAIIFSDRKSVK